MSIKIGHASIDENGNATGGAAGDQTGKELCTRDWYTKGWNVLLRPKSAGLAEKSARACEAACANTNIGYDQGGRNTLYAKAKAVDFDLAKITAPCECDCSSLMHVCAIAGGANLAYGGNGHTTRTMVREFVNSGDYIKLTDSKYLNSDKYVQRGDVLVKEGSHTAMVLENGALAEDRSTASSTAAKKENAAIYYSVRLPRLVKGMRGDTVKTMQILLISHGFVSCLTHGEFDDMTENMLRKFQAEFNLPVNGKCGPDTWSALLCLTGVG